MKSPIVTLGGQPAGKTWNCNNPHASKPWDGADDSWRGRLKGWVFTVKHGFKRIPRKLSNE